MKTGMRVHYANDVSDQGEILREETDADQDLWYYVAWDDGARGWYSPGEIGEVASD